MMCTRFSHTVGMRAAHRLAKTVRLTSSRLTYFMDCDLMSIVKALERSSSACTSCVGDSVNIGHFSESIDASPTEEQMYRRHRK